MAHSNPVQLMDNSSSLTLSNRVMGMTLTTQLQGKVIPSVSCYGVIRVVVLVGQEQVASYGQDQGAAFNTAAYTGTGAEQYSQGTAVGYSYNPPAAPYTPNYQDQSTLTASYGQAPQRSQFPPYGGR